MSHAENNFYNKIFLISPLTWIPPRPVSWWQRPSPLASPWLRPPGLSRESAKRQISAKFKSGKQTERETEIESSQQMSPLKRTPISKLSYSRISIMLLLFLSENGIIWKGSAVIKELDDRSQSCLKCCAWVYFSKMLEHCMIVWIGGSCWQRLIAVECEPPSRCLRLQSSVVRPTHSRPPNLPNFHLKLP